MDPGHLPKLRFPRIEQLFAVLEPGDEARALAQPQQTSAAFFATLIDRGLFVDAIRYLAVALPRREAVWWACATHRKLPVADAPDAEIAAWQAAETWVYEPTEPHRLAAYRIADALKFNTAGAYATLGVFWSGGSLAPPETGQHIPPGDALTGSAVSASVLFCCVPGEAKLIGERQRLALGIGVDIANGGSGLEHIQ